MREEYKKQTTNNNQIAKSKSKDEVNNSCGEQDFDSKMHKYWVYAVAGGILFCMIMVVMIIFVPIQTATEKEEPTEFTSVPYQVEEKANLTKSGYYVEVKNGLLEIYDADSNVLYLQTSILLDLLPEELIEEIEEGKSFSSKAEVLEFLESYSS